MDTEKTLLGLIASPRKFGNSELFVKEVYRGFPKGWQLRLIRLPELDVRPCRACYQCLFGEMKCPQDDDMEILLGELANCDAYLVAAPTYFLGANSTLKRVLDRGLSFYAVMERLWGKPAAGVGIAGIEGLEGQTKLDIDRFIKLTFGDLRETAILYAALPGEIFLAEGGRVAAARLAEAILRDATNAPWRDGLCPICGGDTFRFLPDDRVRCMLCSNTGTFSCSDGTVRMDIREGGHPLFRDLESARRHLEWLRSMKDRFIQSRKELKKVTVQYTRTGTWVRSKKELD
ncbi:MAG: flavodoxin family protein [Deltaproteobacteria bacterium]|nr:flavodoxin family protein [Deltaproteobacteria bacterium]